MELTVIVCPASAYQPYLGLDMSGSFAFSKRLPSDPLTTNSQHDSEPTPHMSHANSTASSSNTQLIVNNALKAYEKRTKKDHLAHPLAPALRFPQRDSRNPPATSPRALSVSNH